MVVVPAAIDRCAEARQRLIMGDLAGLDLIF
jgi:hypothetical protein